MFKYVEYFGQNFELIGNHCRSILETLNSTIQYKCKLAQPVEL